MFNVRPRLAQDIRIIAKSKVSDLPMLKLN
jgi:hypothetical protein